MNNHNSNNSENDESVITDVIGGKLYHTNEVKEKIRHLIKTSDFLDFNREYGIRYGWKALDMWLEENIK